jgi:hypothetical protein
MASERRMDTSISLQALNYLLMVKAIANGLTLNSAQYTT